MNPGSLCNRGGASPPSKGSASHTHINPGDQPPTAIRWPVRLKAPRGGLASAFVGTAGVKLRVLQLCSGGGNMASDREQGRETKAHLCLNGDEGTTHHPHRRVRTHTHCRSPYRVHDQKHIRTHRLRYVQQQLQTHHSDPQIHAHVRVRGLTTPSHTTSVGAHIPCSMKTTARRARLHPSAAESTLIHV